MVGALALHVAALVAADSAPNFLLLLLHDHAMCLCIQGIMLALHAAVLLQAPSKPVFRRRPDGLRCAPVHV